MRSVVIEPGSTEQQYWRDLWRYRELFLVLAWRDVAVRYKQTLIGLAWALLQPLLIMVSFTVIFGRVAKMPSEGSAPYALLVLSGLLARSEEHTSELQSLMRISYAVFCLKKKNKHQSHRIPVDLPMLISHNT